MSRAREAMIILVGISFLTAAKANAEETEPLDDPTLATLSCPPDPKLGPEIAAKRFLYAFTRLDRDCFDQMWADDATAFLPLRLGKKGPGRLDGKQEIMEAFDLFFEGTEPSEEDQMGVSPASLQVKQHGDVAVVSFLLGPSLDNRRSFIMRREDSGWRIWHHHGSWLGDWEKAVTHEVSERLAAKGHKERADVLAAIDTFLDAISDQNADLMASVTIPTGSVSGLVSADGGTTFASSTFEKDYERLRAGSDSQWVEDYWKPTILIEDRLAVLMAPYSMHADGKPVHCGTDVFNLARIDGSWKIVSIQFTADPKGCPPEIGKPDPQD